MNSKKFETIIRVVMLSFGAVLSVMVVVGLFIHG